MMTCVIFTTTITYRSETVRTQSMYRQIPGMVQSELPNAEFRFGICTRIVHVPGADNGPMRSQNMTATL
jgi:hypothetical protein